MTGQENPIINLWRLECFLALAEELHFGRAARRLHISQPALSQQIKQLEADLGLKLAHRTGGVSLTQAGEVLRKEGMRLILAAREIEEIVRGTRAILSGKLRVLYARSLPVNVETQLVQDFREANPSVEIAVQSMWTSWNIESLKDGSADVTFVRLPLHDQPEIHTKMLGTDVLLLAMPKNHELAKVPVIDQANMPPTTMVPWAKEQAPEIWDTLFESWDHRAVTFTQAEPDLHRRIAIAQHLNAVTPVYDWMVRSLPTGMITRPISPSPTTEYGIAWRRGDRSPLVDAFVRSTHDWSPSETW